MKQANRKPSWGLVAAGALVIVAAIALFLNPLGIIPFDLPILELSVLAVIAAIFLVSLTFRQKRNQPTFRTSEEEDDVVATHIALDMMNGELDGQYFDHDD